MKSSTMGDDKKVKRNSRSVCSVVKGPFLYSIFNKYVLIACSGTGIVDTGYTTVNGLSPCPHGVLIFLKGGETNNKQMYHVPCGDKCCRKKKKAV